MYCFNVCPRKFIWKTNLLTHRQTHTGIKNFTCEICGHRSLLKAQLKAHIKAVHIKPTNKNSSHYSTKAPPNPKLNIRKPTIQKTTGKRPRFVISLLLNQDVTPETKPKQKPKDQNQFKLNRI